MATFPPRRSKLDIVISSIAPQVDQMNVVLNEFDSVPEEFSAPENVIFHIPETDTKDTGKFLPDVGDAEFVFTLDDDIHYPADYIEKTIAHVETLGPDPFVAGYHASWYLKSKPGLFSELKRRARLLIWPNHMARYREMIHFATACNEAICVEQLGTGTLVMRGKHYPGFSAMQSSQKFVDVRFAAICHNAGLPRVCLPREAGWLEPIDFSENCMGGDIYTDFTSSYPEHVTDEIRTFAFQDPRVGQVFGS